MANTNTTDVNSDWNPTTDIYDISKSITAVKKRYIDDQDETTLSLGIYGFLSDVLSKEIQTDVIMTGLLGNEMFPNRAQLSKNVLAHAVYNSILDINAVPATITINIGFKVEDFDKYAINNKFVFDHMCGLFIDTYEFHFDYDVILTRSNTSSNIYTARYDMTVENRISDIKQPYLNQPFVVQIGDYEYIVFQATVRQCTIMEINDKMVSESVIDNKTYTFALKDQLVDFDVYVNDQGTVTKLRPLLVGSADADVEEAYCWYMYINDNTIRINFDNKSYIPGINCDIYIKAWTTLGEKGNFTYKTIDDQAEGFFTEVKSDYLGYNNVNCYIITGSDSTGGEDRKTKEDLQKLIPKAAAARGNITTDNDVSNYFNLIETQSDKIEMRKKQDNNLARIWYAYLLLKDDANNIIPTNTVAVQIDASADYVVVSEDGRLTVPAGTIIKYDGNTKIGTVIEETDVPPIYSEEYYANNCYYYIIIYNVVLTPDPLHAAFFMTTVDDQSYFIYNWVNEDCLLQFVANKCTFARNLLTDQSIYKFKFSLAQSISGDFGMYKEEVINGIDDNGDNVSETVVTNNMACVVVFYKNDAPYRWMPCELDHFDTENYVASWSLNLTTDNDLDDKNNIKILDLHEIGRRTATSYGYFDERMSTKIYVLAKFTNGERGRYDLDDIAPGYEGYSVTNVYEVSEGLRFFDNYTGITNTKTYVDDEQQNLYTISTIPVVGMHYMTDDERADYFMNALEAKRNYIKYCIDLLENNMEIDYKFFNTYGPSLCYNAGDKEKTPIGHIDIDMKFRASLKNANDIYTKNDIIAAIKDYIEDLNQTGSWHAPVMIAALMDEFNTRVNYIEFMNYNDFRLGMQHIIREDSDDPHIPPEFINVRNILDVDGSIIPDIDLEIVDN